MIFVAIYMVSKRYRLSQHCEAFGKTKYGCPSATSGMTLRWPVARRPSQSSASGLLPSVG